ncbi:MAG: YihY/virulence factor BrkB family protein [Kiritimatiellia bacterium]
MKHSKENESRQDAPSRLATIRTFCTRIPEILSNAVKTAKARVPSIWDANPDKLPTGQRILIKFLRMVALTVRDFLRNDCTLHASRLSYLTVLSLVPLIALALFFMKTIMNEDELCWRAKKTVHEIIASDFGLSVLADDSDQYPELEVDSFEEANAILLLRKQEALEQNFQSAPLSVPGKPSAGETPEPTLNEAKILNLIDTNFKNIAGLNFNALGSLGFLLLLWTAITVLSDIERSFNHLWGVRETRPLLRKFTDYLSAIILIPFLATAATTIPIMATIQQHMDRSQLFSSSVKPFLQTGLFRTFFVVFFLTLAFTFLLRATPNTRVRALPGFVGGFFSAIGILVWVKLCILLQIGVARQSALFGSFATLPILLIWIYVSWCIVLASAQLTVSIQNASTHPGPATNTPASMNARMRLASDLLHVLAANLSSGGNGILDVDAYAASHTLPARFLAEVVSLLERIKVIAPIADRPNCYSALVDFHTFTAADLLRAIMADGASASDFGVQSMPLPPSASTFLPQ